MMVWSTIDAALHHRPRRGIGVEGGVGMGGVLRGGVGGGARVA